MDAQHDEGDFDFYSVKRTTPTTEYNPVHDAPAEEETEESVYQSLLGKEEDVGDADQARSATEREERERTEEGRERAEEETEDLEDPIPRYFFLLTLVPFFVKGLLDGLPSLARFYFFKDELHEDPATVGFVVSMTSLIPWSIKPLYGVVTDAFPIAGFRRKPYIIAGAILTGICWCLMASIVTRLSQAAVLLTFANFGSAFANVCAEAVTVECSNGRSFGRAATLQSWQWGTGMLASMIGSIIGGYALDALGTKTLFWMTGGCGFIQVLAAVVAEEPPFSKAQMTYKEIVSEWWDAISTACTHPITVKVLIFIFILFSTPTNGDASNYFYTNHLHMESWVLATVGILGNLAGIIGIVVYQRFMRGFAVRPMIFWATFVGCLLSLLGVLLYTGANRKMGIPDVPFLLTDSTISVIVSQFCSMPLLALVAVLCPAGVEGTVFSVFTAVMNFGSLVGMQIGAALTLAFGVTAHDFTLMWALALTTSLCQLYPLVFLWLIPGGRAKDVKRHSH